MISIYIICVAAGILLSAVFSGADKAIATMSLESLEKLADANVRGARSVIKMIGNRRRFMLMLTSGRTLSVILGTVFLYLTFNELSSMPRLSWIPFLMSIAVAYFLFVIAESLIAPFISAGEFEDRIARFGYLLFFFHILLIPIVMPVYLLLSLAGREKADPAEQEEAFLEMVKAQSESGVIEEEEGEMIRSIVELSQTSVREVMVPRIDMVAAEKEITLPELLDLFEEAGHSRIPVYEDRIDNILGVIYAKDLLTHIAGKGLDDFDIIALMREAYFVPETKNISELLEDIKKNKVHLIIVIDEYGGTAGIVALEDLLEEIVGEIQDEFDVEDERDFVWLNDRSIIIDAGLDVDDVNDILRTDIPSEHFDTLGGFIFHYLGYIPESGEEMEWESIRFKIKEINGNRISKVVVVLPSARQKNGRNVNGSEDDSLES